MEMSKKAEDLVRSFIDALVMFGKKPFEDTSQPAEDASKKLEDYIMELETENKRVQTENNELKERVAMLDIIAVFKSLGEMGYIEQVANLKAENIKLNGWVDKLLEDYDHPNVALASDIALRLKEERSKRIK